MEAHPLLAVIYYRRYIGDFQADTMHLSMMEQGAYDRLLDYYYAMEQPIPLNKDRAAIICRAVTLEERAAVDSVLATYFHELGDGFHNSRADHEIEVSQTARGNGGKGGRPKRTGTITGLEAGSVTGSETGMGGGSGHPPTTNHQPTTKPKPLSADADYGPAFQTFWESWPTSKRKQAKFKCWQLWRSKKLDGLAEIITAHLEAMKTSEQWRDGFDPAPLTYLNGRRWEDGLPQAPKRRLAI